MLKGRQEKSSVLSKFSQTVCSTVSLHWFVCRFANIKNDRQTKSTTFEPSGFFVFRQSNPMIIFGKYILYIISPFIACCYMVHLTFFEPLLFFETAVYL